MASDRPLLLSAAILLIALDRPSPKFERGISYTAWKEGHAMNARLVGVVAIGLVMGAAAAIAVFPDARQRLLPSAAQP